MRTSKPVSTISYNSKEKLEETLNSLYRLGKVSFWAAVKHDGETLEDGTIEKDHWHVYVEPNERIDTMEVQKLSQEFDPKKPDKFLKMIDFRPSKWEDWIWYTLHDADYLRTKAEFREFCYTPEDYIFSDEDEFRYRYQRARNSSVIAQKFRTLKLLQEHSVAQLCALGIIQPGEALNYGIFEKAFRDGQKQLAVENKRIEAEHERLRQLEGSLADPDGKADAAVGSAAPSKSRRSKK